MGISPSDYLRRELRRRRTAAGLTQAQLGERVYCSDTQVSAIETGGKPLTRRHLELVDAALSTGDYFMTLWDELVKDSEEVTPAWVHDWFTTERTARALNWYEPLTVPGLLQTEAYARAVFEAGGLLSPDTVDRLIVDRMARRDVLTRADPPQVVVVLDQHVLQRRIGGREVMREQLEYLLKVGAELPHLRIHVVPLSAGAYPGLSGPFVIAIMPDDEGDIVYLDNQARGQLVHRGDELSWIHRVWDSVLGEALPVDQSAALIRKAMEEL